jgi:hypothetical protein
VGCGTYNHQRISDFKNKGEIMHPCEPSLETLKEIRKELYTANSTEENVKKIKAVELQISRIEKEAKETKEATCKS